ncbi:MAG TPA: hypothetical protein VGS80_13180, partial [Ktedonobacterales bacterium]|nr:hypothetical protein [Ktedonobacterales bacterium]
MMRDGAEGSGSPPAAVHATWDGHDTQVPGPVDVQVASLRTEMVEREQALRLQMVEREQALRLQMAERERALGQQVAAHKELLRTEMAQFERAVIQAHRARLTDVGQEQLNRLLDELDRLETEYAQTCAQRDQYASQLRLAQSTKAWKATAAYWRARREGPLGFAKLLYHAVVPYRLRRDLWYRRHTGASYRAATTERPSAAMADPAHGASSGADGAEPARNAGHASVSVTGVKEARGPDIICFPIIDWDFRFQRPQQLLSRFAQAGHRVYYLRTSFAGLDQSAVTTRQLAEGVHEVCLPGDAQIALHRDRLPLETLHAAFRALRDLCQHQ